MGNLLSSVSCRNVFRPRLLFQHFLCSLLLSGSIFESLDPCPTGPFFHRPQAANPASRLRGFNTAYVSSNCVSFRFFEFLSSKPHFSTSSILTCFLKQKKTVNPTMRNKRTDPRSTQCVLLCGRRGTGSSGMISSAVWFSPECTLQNVQWKTSLAVALTLRTLVTLRSFSSVWEVVTVVSPLRDWWSLFVQITSASG